MGRDDEGRRLYSCSFCGKLQTQVKKIIFGPGVSICDECVALCVPIIADTSNEGSPASFMTPESSTTEQLLTLLKAYDGAADSVDSNMRDLVDILREREISWSLIGETLGVSRQAAWKRFG